MKIFILSSGEYGSKIVNGIANNGFAGKIIGMHEFPPSEELPEFIEDISEYIPENIPKADLIIAVGIHGDVNMVIPEVVEKSNAKSVIVPIYHPQQVPIGLQNEIKKSLDEEIAIVFPKPFCSLLPIGDKFIDEFTTVFGKPKFEIQTDKVVKSVKVLRGAPCGSSWYIAENIIGTPVDDAEFEANNKLHNFPCSSSMNIDNATGDTILHLASYRMKEAIKRTLGFTNRAAVVDEEICEGSGGCEHFCLNSCPNVLSGTNTISLKTDGKAYIDPGSCGVCEICIKECPYGVIEVYEEKISVEKDSK
ncbi:MAG: thymidylate synthase [Methanobacteriaceae archaeon]|nr:thymidylate synthase [Candidatus Methanorudis spinitermitis]